jgi:hypothetical protein
MSAALSIIGTDTARKDERPLQFRISAGTSQLTFGLMQNDGPKQRVVMRADGIDAEAYHVDSSATESESRIRIQLKNPYGHDLAKNRVISRSLPITNALNILKWKSSSGSLWRATSVLNHLTSEIEQAIQRNYRY